MRTVAQGRPCDRPTPATRHRPFCSHRSHRTFPISTIPSASAPSQEASTSGREASSDPAADWHVRLLQTASKARDRPRKKKAPRFPEWNSDNFLDEDEDFNESDGGGGYMTTEKRVPAEMRCFDTARINVKSGSGGSGCVAFRREAHVEHGGPAGGNGGKGGNIWAVADESLNSLIKFRGKVHFTAKNGQPGQGSQRNGADGDDLYVSVPPGTIIRKRDAEEDEAPLAELLQPGQVALLVAGGRGGRGNMSFKTQKNKAPALAERGEAGHETWLQLELKVVADVGIVGVPNAGKSTLLSVVTSARPKIANYPFTTLVPNLGVCEMDYRTTVFADIPGLLEGAHEGLGLGHEFLRHVQRCQALVHVIDGTSRDPLGDFHAINLELELFNPELKDKPQVIAYNKVDVPDSGDYWEDVRDYLVEQGVPADNIFAISAASGRGVTDLVRRVRALLDTMGSNEPQPETDAMNLTSVPRPKMDMRLDDFSIEMEEEEGSRWYTVRGTAVERFAQMTNWDYYEAVRRFQRILEVSGINSSLKAKGIAEGDTVVLGETEFEWNDDQSETAMYGAWLDHMKNSGKGRIGSARWPSKGW